MASCGFKSRRELLTGEKYIGNINGMINEAVRYAAQFSIYDPETTLRELTTSQCLLLSLLYGLLRKDAKFCTFIINNSWNAVQLWSSFIKVWLKDDFFFKTNDIAKAISNLAVLMDCNSQLLPQNIAVAISGLVDKYKLFDVFYLSGDQIALEFVTALNLYILDINKKQETLLQDDSENLESASELMTHNVESDIRTNLSNKASAIDEESTVSPALSEDVSGARNPSTVQCSPSATSSSVIQEVNEACGYSDPAPTALSSQLEDDIKICLEDAVRRNDITTTISLLERGLNVNEETASGQRLLHLGVHSGCAETVGVLLAFGAIPQLKNKDLITPLQLAVQLNTLPIIKLLLMNGGDINETFSDGNSLLHKIVSAAALDTLITLLALKPALDFQNNDGHTALHLATKAKFLHIMQALINAGAAVNILSKEKETCLHISVINGDIEAISILMRAKANPYLKHKSGLNAFHLSHNINVLNFFISRGVSVNTRTNKDDTLLHLVAFKGNTELAKRLIEVNATVNATNKERNTPLLKAIEGGHTEIISLLINAGARVNYVNPLTRDAPINVATKTGKIECVKLLLDAGADVNTEGDNKWAPIHNAAHGGYSSIVSLLIQRGADVNLRNNDNDTALHWAAYNGFRQTAEILIDSGADINAKGDFGNTPLKVATSVKKTSLIRLLKERGARL